MTKEQQDFTQQREGGNSGWSAPGGFFDWIRGSGIHRSDERWLAGVCGGLAERTGIDPLVIRGIAIVIALLGGPIFLAYAAGWALLPDTTGRIHVERMLRGVFDPAIIAIGVFVALTFVPFAQGIWWQGLPLWWGMPGWLESTLRTGWIIALVAGIIWLIVVLARRMPQMGRDSQDAPRSHSDFWTSDAEPQPQRPASFAAGTAGPAAPNTASAPFSYSVGSTGPTGSTSYVPDPADADRRRHEAWQRHEQTRLRHAERMREHAERQAERAARWRDRQPSAAYIAISLGLAVVAAGGAVVFAQQSGWPDVAVVLALASGLAVLAVATIVAGIRGRESGGLGFFTFASVVALVITGVVPSGAQLSMFGDTTWDVSRASTSDNASYAMFAGGPTLDLRDLDESRGDVDLWLAFGAADIRLPEDTPVRVEVSGFITSVDASDAQDSRFDDDGDRGGMFYTTVVENEAAETASADEITTVHAWIFIGAADIER